MKDRAEILKDIQLFVLDLDGTVYLGDSLLPGTLSFLDTVKKLGRKVLFFTNNTSRSPEEYLCRLDSLGIPVTRRDLLTAGDVAISYLNHYYRGKSVYLLGVPSLAEQFRAGGIALTEERPDVVMVGFDKTLTYDKLCRACVYLRQGAVFLATHPDINCPTEAEPIPDCGAICEAIRCSTGREPRVLGKPSPETVAMVLGSSGLHRDEVAFVGDRLYTDVACGTKNGAKGLLVLTGEATREDVACADFTPDGVYDSLGEIAALLQEAPAAEETHSPL